MTVHRLIGLRIPLPSMTSRYSAYSKMSAWLSASVTVITACNFVFYRDIALHRIFLPRLLTIFSFTRIISHSSHSFLMVSIAPTINSAPSRTAYSITVMIQARIIRISKSLATVLQPIIQLHMYSFIPSQQTCSNVVSN